MGNNVVANTISRFILLVLLFCGAGMATAAGVGNANENKVRAAVVMGIIRYTSWGSDIGDSLDFCLVGTSESFRFIRGLHNKKEILGIPIHIIEVENPNEITLSACEVLLLGKTKAPVASFKSASPRLTICDRCEENQSDPAVVIRKVDNRIRFDVSLGNAKAAGVAFKSAMLELAANVEGARE